ncbi:MAG: transglutaminase family protein [Bacteroidetes bacterium]|nr:MAG: transglutaminase family protein [Bacteroidota bacterium]
MKTLVENTPLLDFNHPSLQQLIDQRGWKNLSVKDQIQSIYHFVRDEIVFGYNVDDALPASTILKDGYGQCNTKSTLLMALLRGVGIPCRLHGFTIHKALQKGAITGIWYLLSPTSILHTWVEVEYKGKWNHLEGVILDRDYLAQLQRCFGAQPGEFCGYGAYTEDLTNPEIDWAENNTYIQAKGINADFGLFNSPDEFYQIHKQALNPIRGWIFRNIARHSMNANVQKIRAGRLRK